LRTIGWFPPLILFRVSVHRPSVGISAFMDPPPSAFKRYPPRHSYSPLREWLFFLRNVFCSFSASSCPFASASANKTQSLSFMLDPPPLPPPVAFPTAHCATLSFFWRPFLVPDRSVFPPVQPPRRTVDFRHPFS